MKKIIVCTMAVVAFLAMSACCGDNHNLTAKKAKSLVSKEMKRQHELTKTVSIPVGYFEVADPDARYQLRQLEANGLITYKCDRVKKIERTRKTRRVQRSYGWYSYYDTESYYVKDTVDAYFVTVELTKKGQELVVDEEAEIEPTADEKELRLDREHDLSKYPESSVNYDEFATGLTAPVDTVSDEAVEDEVYEEVMDYAETESAAEATESDDMSDYDRALSKVNMTYVKVKAYDIKIVKVRNIVQLNDNVAVGEVLLESTNVTPAGRIVGKVFDGDRDLERNAKFVYFQDKGWTFDPDDDVDFSDLMSLLK